MNRKFLRLFSLALLISTAFGETQPPKTAPRIGFLSRFWNRLVDRSRIPRRWWYPILSTEVRHKTIVLDAHQKYSETITKAMLTLLGIAFFCLLTVLGSPDRLLLAEDSTVKVPFADAAISLRSFVIVAPLLLSVVTVYLHIFYGYWLELERERRQINQSLIGTGEQQIEGVPSLFYFSDRLPRFLTSLIFYGLVPLIFVRITWTALARPEIGRPLIYITGIVTLILVFLQIRRRPDNRRRWWSLLSFFMLALIIGLMVLSSFYRDIFRRPLNLFRAEMSKAWLVRMDMRGANASYANLQEAKLWEANLENAKLVFSNLQDADLQNAGLRWTRFWGANLQRANLNSATLQEAYLRDANLQEANLSRAHLQGAIFMGANLQGANLQEASFQRLAGVEGANLRGANLQGADLEGANLEGADLQKANVKDANLKMTILRNADLTDTNVREARNWTSAIYDAEMLKKLGLKPNHNEELIGSLSEELRRRFLKRESGPQIVNEKVRGQRPGDWSIALYRRDLTSDQYAQISIVTFKDNNPCFAGIVLRGSATGYYAFVALKNDAGGYTTKILQNIRGDFYELAAETSAQWKGGDVLRAAAEGRNLTVYRNGVVVLTASDSSIRSGQAGIVIGCHSGDIANAEIDDFLSGDLLKGRKR